MRATAIASGGQGTRQYTKEFQFQSPEDEALVASCERVKTMLRRQQRININEAILLFLAFAVSSVKERKGRRQIRKEASSMLSPEQVMIGVPEMLRRLDFRIVLGDKKFTISLSRPIPIQDFSFGSAEAWGQLPVC